MPSPFVWHVWPGQGWPASPAQELAFLDELREASAGTVAEPNRASVTCLLGALRCGITFEALREHLPGVSAAEMLAGYEMLEMRRAQAEKAWRSLVGDPSASSVAEHTPRASLLLPVPVRRIATAVATLHSRGALDRLALEVATHVARHAERSEALEEQLTGFRHGDLRGIVLGTQLHNPLDPALWSEPYFLAERVGALSPTRVADLLGERAAVEDVEWD